MSIVLQLVGNKFTITGSGNYLRTEEHNSLVIDLANDIFYWNSRSIVGDAYVWLTEVEGYTPTDAKEAIRNLDKGHQVFVSIKTVKGEDICVYPKLVGIFWENGKNNRDYWYKRGFTDDLIDRFQLGYTDGWYTIPIFMDGTFLNFQIRRDEPHKKILSWYRGVGGILFNSDILKMTSEVVITESPTDAMLLNGKGIPAVSHNGGAGYWNTAWFKYFMKQDKIYIAYDNDEAGRKGAIKVAKELGVYRCYTYTFSDYEAGYDVGDWVLHNFDKSFGQLLEEKARRIFE